MTEHSLPKVDLPDAELAAAYERAATQNVLACLHSDVRFGHWTVCADGVDFGYEASYPSLDGHQIADALLRLDVLDEVRANWDYIRSFQRPDGALPLAIIPGVKELTGSAAIPKVPVDPNGGLYQHWVPGDPLRALAPVTFIQNADALFRRTQDQAWLERELPAVNRAGDFLAGLTSNAGAVGGAGYYVERPLRAEWDGVTQGHAYDAANRLAALNERAGDTVAAKRFAGLAQRISTHFQQVFWVGEHFAEYIHPQRGPVASHGLSDSDWTALATGIATAEQERTLWPQLRDDAALWYGGMPTGIAAKPEAYEPWEFSVADRHDLASMGRVWYVEAQARARMDDAAGLMRSLLRVAQAGRETGYYWRERYHPQPGGGCRPGGARQYVEYPANLIRVVHRLLLGVEMRVDGDLVVKPCAPEEFWRRGFGQVVHWGDCTLDFRFQGREMTGTLTSPRPVRIYTQAQWAAGRAALADGRAVERCESHDGAAGWRFVACPGGVGFTIQA